MKQKIQIIPSGIAFIDKVWGGLYQGGTYLLVGSHKSGRTTLAIEFANEIVKQQEVCIFFTTRRPKDLILHAASMNIDLQRYISQNSLVVVRVESAIELGETRDTDTILAEYIEDIVEVVAQYQPAKIVFDEITPFLGFGNIKLLEDTFAKTIEEIEDQGVTSLFVLGDPITAGAKRVVNILAGHSTGIIYLHMKENGEDKLSSGIISITPNIGHPQRKFRSNYSIIPGKGFSFESYNSVTPKYYANDQTKVADLKYKSLSEFNAPKNEYLLPNLYGIEDFNLIINSQIAYYKSTGQAFTLVSFKVDENAIKNGLLTVNQLGNAVRLSVEKKDRICVISNKVIVLLTKEDQKDITGLIARVKSNLAAKDNAQLMNIISSVSVYALRVDESVKTSDDLLKELGSDELKGKNNFRFS